MGDDADDRTRKRGGIRRRRNPPGFGYEKRCEAHADETKHGCAMLDVGMDTRGMNGLARTGETRAMRVLRHHGAQGQGDQKVHRQKHRRLVGHPRHTRRLRV